MGAVDAEAYEARTPGPGESVREGVEVVDVVETELRLNEMVWSWSAMSFKNCWIAASGTCGTCKGNMGVPSPMPVSAGSCGA